MRMKILRKMTDTEKSKIASQCLLWYLTLITVDLIPIEKALHAVIYISFETKIVVHIWSQMEALNLRVFSVLPTKYLHRHRVMFLSQQAPIFPYKGEWEQCSVEKISPV